MPWIFNKESTTNSSASLVLLTLSILQFEWMHQTYIKEKQWSLPLPTMNYTVPSFGEIFYIKISNRWCWTSGKKEPRIHVIQFTNYRHLNVKNKIKTLNLNSRLVVLLILNWETKASTTHIFLIFVKTKTQRNKPKQVIFFLNWKTSDLS